GLVHSVRKSRPKRLMRHDHKPQSPPVAEAQSGAMVKRWRLRFPVAPIKRLRADFEVRKTNGVNGTVAATEETPHVRSLQANLLAGFPTNLMIRHKGSP